MKAMILAAGFGTRLRPVTYMTPKVMVPLCGRPLIAWAVESLLSVGVRDFVVNLHHLPEPVERYLRARYRSDVRFEFSHESEILGTGGGVRKVRSLLETEGDFFLVNGDTIQFPPYDDLRSVRRERDCLAALTLRHPPLHDRFTPVYHADGLVTGFGKGIGEALMFSGTHIMSARVFNEFPDKDVFGMIDEVYQPLIESGRERVAGVVDDGPWFDIGTPLRYMAASHSLLAMTVAGRLSPAAGWQITGDSLIHETARLRGTIKRTVAGARSVVDGDLRDSVVWDDCRIAPGVVLNSCVVAHGVEISRPVELHDVVVCRDDERIPRQGEHRFDHGLVLRDI